MNKVDVKKQDEWSEWSRGARKLRKSLRIEGTQQHISSGLDVSKATRCSIKQSAKDAVALR